MIGMLFPIWKGSIVFYESILPLRNNAGVIDDIPLLYSVDEITDVISATYQYRYIEGHDYTIVDGKMHIPKTSTIPALLDSEDYPKFPIPDASFPKLGGGNVLFDNESFFHEHQTLVTYRHHDKWQWQIPADKSNLLPGLRKILQNALPLKIVFFGDSISAGYNSSSFVFVPPYMPDWCSMTCLVLEQVYGSKITSIRSAENGTDSQWGVKNARERVTQHRPDLLILGYGMNDRDRNPDEFIDNIQSIIAAARKGNPSCETVLISTMLPNKEAEGFFVNQMKYESYLLSLEQEGVAVCNLTQVHEMLLRRKAYRDMTGNNINHPNDYLSRVYAQTLLATLGVQLM